MKRILKHILLLAVLINLLIAQTAERKNMAIYNFTALGVSNIEARVISDRIRTEIAKFDTYSIIERGLMEQILEEQVLQLSGLCDDASCLVEVGQILAVHYMVGGSVSKIGNLFTIEARIIDVESGQIVTSVVEDYSGPIENLLVQTTKVVAAKLMGENAEEGSLLLTGTCDLMVVSNPLGATIYVNEKPMGDVTPYRLEGLREGAYKIQVKKGNLIGETDVSLARNERKEIIVTLMAEQFILRIYSEPTGAEVFVNQENIGKTPIDYTVTDTTCDYQIQLHKEMYFHLDERTHFSNSSMLRLNYILEPCGQIIIPFQEEVDVSLNGSPMDQLGDVQLTGKLIYTSRNWIIGQLAFANYEVKIEKKYYEIFEKTVDLRTSEPVKTINYNLRHLQAKTKILSNADGTGWMKGIQVYPIFLKSGQSSEVLVPYGNYTLAAKAEGFLPLKQNLALFSESPDPISISFQRPDKKRAVKRSLLLPGLGQIYSQQSKKGFVLGALTSVGVAWLIKSLSDYSTELDSYNTLSYAYLEATSIEAMGDYRTQLNTSRDKLTGHRKQFIIASSLTVFSYTWNVFDITVLYPYD